MERKKAELYLIEDFAPGMVEAGDGIIAVSPEAAYALDRRGIRYTIAEDYHHGKEMFAGEDEYFLEQLEWLRRFDALLKKRIPYCAQEGLDLATAHYYRIKSFVDTLVIYSRTFLEIFRRTGAKDALYVRKKDDPAIGMYAPFAAQKAALCPLASRVAAKCGVKFSVFDIPGEAPEEAPPLFSKDRAKEILKTFYIRAALRSVKYAKWETLLAKKPGKGAINVLSLHAGCTAHDELIKGVMRSGGKVFLKEGRSVLLVNDPFEGEVLDAGSLAQGYDAIRTRKVLEGVFEEFMNDEALAGWVNKKCGVDVSGIMRPYFEDLVLNVIFENLTDLPVLKEFYDREEIDFVVARSSSEKECVSSLLAAAAAKKRVCMQHACGAYECKHDHITDLALFDHYFAMHGEAEEQARAVCGAGGYVKGCDVHQASKQMLETRKKYNVSKRDPSLVLYVPTKLFLGFRCYNGTRYSVTWYYGFQKALIDLFASRKDMRFIFKHAVGQDWAERSILPYIKEKGADNIVIDKRPLSECLGKAGRAIVDYPATGLYEVAAAGIPVLGLYPNTLKIMPQAEKLFGRSLRMFISTDDAVKAAGDFLSADPSPYRVDVPMQETDVVEILRRIKEGK